MEVFEPIRQKRWEIKGLNLPIKAIGGDLQKPKWKDLKEEITDHGIVLYGRCQAAARKDQYLVRYETDSMNIAQRMRLARKLYGYMIRKDGKEYPQTGLVEKEGGSRIGQNVFVIPANSKKTVEFLLRGAGARFQMMKIAI